MAVLHKKEEKIQAVLGRLPKKYTQEEFVAMFIKLYSKDWGKIKSAYIKQAQDKEPGTVIAMPKPDLYLKQVLDIYLKQNAVAEPIKKDVAPAKAPIVKDEPIKAAAKKKIEVIKPKATKTSAATDVIKKEKVAVKKKAESKAPLNKKEK
jgi:hypothetical protein